MVFKIKVITLANHKRHRHSSEPMKSHIVMKNQSMFNTQLKAALLSNIKYGALHTSVGFFDQEVWALALPTLTREGGMEGGGGGGGVMIACSGIQAPSYTFLIAEAIAKH